MCTTALFWFRRVDPPPDRDPLDRYPPRTESPWKEHGTRQPDRKWHHTENPPWTDKHLWNYYLTLNEVWGKVMFLHPSVILFTGGVSAPLHAGMHAPPPADPPRCYGIRSTNGRYASYWNAYLFYEWILDHSQLNGTLIHWLDHKPS